MTPLFPSKILKNHLSNYNLENITNINNIRSLIDAWCLELDSGKINSQKEEQIKPRFVTDFFGDILGFNPKNGRKWLLSEEQKTDMDATKADGALGYFYKDRDKNITRAVIEIKNANTDLDKPQKRKKKMSPVEQAFEYAKKMSPQCKWVIVSNIKEIRFYHAKDNSKFQSYLLSNLKSDEYLKELLFLFHKDKFISKNSSSDTDKLLELIQDPKKLRALIDNKSNNQHILYRIYNTLKKFDGIEFIDPHYIASIPPFNILNQEVWHYTPYTLFTLNEEIFTFIKQITIDKNNNIILSNNLKMELESYNNIDYMTIIQWVFNRLNNCLITEIRAVKNIAKYRIRHSLVHHFDAKPKDTAFLNINIDKGEDRNCILYNYNELNINRFLEGLDIAEDNLSFYNLKTAYAFYLIRYNGCKRSYAILRNIEINTKGKEEKYAEYFITKYNLHLIQYHMTSALYFGKDKNEIIEYSKSIDLDNVISNELELIAPEVRKYLILIKENHYRTVIENNIDHLSKKIDNLKKLYDRGGWSSPTNYINEIYNEFLRFLRAQ